MMSTVLRFILSPPLLLCWYAAVWDGSRDECERPTTNQGEEDPLSDGDGSKDECERSTTNWAGEAPCTKKGDQCKCMGA